MKTQLFLSKFRTILWWYKNDKSKAPKLYRDCHGHWVSYSVYFMGQVGGGGGGGGPINWVV